MAEYASKGVAGTGLGLGIAGTLGNITKTVIPMSAICEQPMPRFNSWVAPTNTPATGA